MGMEVYMLQAGIGDCILVRCGEGEKKINILIDSGQGASVFEKAIRKIKRNNEKIDMLVLTHDDNDHVKGACNLLKQLNGGEAGKRNPCAKKVLGELTEERILFNFGGNDTEVLLKAEDVKELSEQIMEQIDFHKLDFVLSDEKEQEGIPYPNMIQLRWECENGEVESEIIRQPTEEDLNTEKEHLEIIMLSPKRETLLRYIENAWKDLKKKEVLLKASESKKVSEWNKSIQYWMENPMKMGDDGKMANNASIAFLLRYKGMYALFAGDAAPDDMVAAGQEYLGRSGKTEKYLDVALIKLPHHGSSHNINREFLNFFRTKTYLISTKSHSGYQHPGKGTLALIAEMLEEAETADIYSSYSWWKENETFYHAERREKNWDVNKDTCELRGLDGNKKYLTFHKLSNELLPVNSVILLSR